MLTDVFFEAVLEMVKHPSTGDDLSDCRSGSRCGSPCGPRADVGGPLKLVAPLAARAVQAAVTRDREYLADATAMGITRNTAGLASRSRSSSRGTSGRTRTGAPSTCGS